MVRASIVAVLLVLAGCGSAEKTDESTKSGSDAAKGSTMVGDCAADSTQVTAAKTLVSADLDGDGTAEPVKLTGAGGDCSSTLFAKLGEGYVATVVPAEPPVSSAFAVALPGQKSQLVVTKADHPRGGYQLRVYAAGTDKLVELLVDGNPLPFVATDVQENPWSIDCSSDGLVFTQAVAHEPAGIAPAWDIKQTTYAVDGTEVTAGPTKEIADNVLPQDLEAKYPDLVKHSAFESCRA